MSFLEKESKAADRGIKGTIIFAVIGVAVSVIHIPYEICLAGILIFGIFIIISVFPFGNTPVSFTFPATRYDERDIMFSRNLLKKGSNRYNAYYSRKPELKEKDDYFRSLPGLLSSDSVFYDPKTFDEAEATFKRMERLNPLVEKPASIQKKQIPPPDELSRFLIDWAKKSGAVSCGITRLENYHLYSHVGRGDNYGKEVDLNHNFAIAFTVEMDREALSYAPRGETVLESAKQYLNAGTIAVGLAELIRSFGYEARAHIDANYRVVCPLVAMDAGLGNIGRMGLLMTPELGPRVRIGVVTTNILLTPSVKKPDSTTIDFCRLCQKCADNCPSHAIPYGEKEIIDGVERWKINSESCFTYWCKAGTDCGKCMQVCPYSHANNPMHNIVRKYIRINPVNRRLALLLDNYFYGKKRRCPSI